MLVLVITRFQREKIFGVHWQMNGRIVKDLKHIQNAMHGFFLFISEM